MLILNYWARDRFSFLGIKNGAVVFNEQIEEGRVVSALQTSNLPFNLLIKI